MTTGDPGNQPEQVQPPAYGAPPPPPYGQPAQPYGQPAQPYGQPAYGQYGPPGAGGFPAARTSSLNIVGAVLVAVGALAVLLAFTTFQWLRSDTSKDFFQNIGSQSKFSRIHDELNQIHDIASGAGNLGEVDFGISRLYFGWLGWVLFVAAVVVAVAALVPTRLAGVLRAVALLLGLVGAGLTLWAIDLMEFSGGTAERMGSHPHFGDYVSHGNVGFWAALVGFLLIGVGGALGPRRNV
jgi:hypothetical protein